MCGHVATNIMVVLSFIYSLLTQLHSDSGAGLIANIFFLSFPFIVYVFLGTVRPHVFDIAQHTGDPGAGVTVTQTRRLPSGSGARLHCPGAFHQQARGLSC